MIISLDVLIVSMIIFNFVFVLIMSLGGTQPETEAEICP